MSENNLEHLWEKGRSGNPKGRPKGTGGKPVSRLRRTLRKLQELEDKSLENIKKSVDGDNIEKEVLASSKWVIGALVTVSKAATAEEQSRVPSEDIPEPSENNVVKFSTTMN